MSDRWFAIIPHHGLPSFTCFYRLVAGAGSLRLPKGRRTPDMHAADRASC
jgi:hypothetical protein